MLGMRSFIKPVYYDSPVKEASYYGFHDINDAEIPMNPKSDHHIIACISRTQQVSRYVFVKIMIRNTVLLNFLYEVVIKGMFGKQSRFLDTQVNICPLSIKYFENE